MSNVKHLASSALFGLRSALLAGAMIAIAAPAIAAAQAATPLETAQQQEAVSGGGSYDPNLPSPFVGSDASAQNAPGASAERCVRPNTPTLRVMKWGYYPGYGCGPVPPAQTIFP